MAFNLIDQPWLPVLDPSGAPAEVSLAEAFAGDHRALAAETPTQNAALLRLLLAVAHAALTPTGTDGWDRWWAQGRLPADRIVAYLESHRARFDLLHPTAPFFQVADLSTAGGPRPAAALIPDAGRMMHTTREGTGRDRLDFAAAARWLVHCHAYDTAGIKAAAAGDPRAVRGKSFPIGAGSMRGAVYYTEGPTLAETLLLNLVPGGGTPAWGREPDTAAPRDGECHGLADLYTWQTRRVRLHHDGEAVTGALVCQGDRSPDQPDPMGLWRLDATKTWRRRNFDPGRHAGEAVSEALPSRHDGLTVRTPAVLRWVAQACARGMIDPSRPVRVHVAGTAYGVKDTSVKDAGGGSITVPAGVLAGSGPLPDRFVTAVAVADRAEYLVAVYVQRLATAAGAVNQPLDLDSPAVVRLRADLDAAMRAWAPAIAGQDAIEDWVARVQAIADAVVEAEPVPAQAWRGRQVEGRPVNAGTAILRYEQGMNKLSIPAATTAPIPERTEPMNSAGTLPAPVYASWNHYLASTTERESLQWCRVKAKTANRERLMSGRPERRVTPLEVWQVVEAAQGRCTYCGSLALERRPSGHDGRPTPWAPVGRRIGSLDHRVAILDGGTNDPANLAWACLWCNTWETERRPGATDHGAIQAAVPLPPVKAPAR